MVSKSLPQFNFRAHSYRELATEAIDCAARYQSIAEQHLRRGDLQITNEYIQLSNAAIARAKRYLILADFAEKTKGLTIDDTAEVAS